MQRLGQLRIILIYKSSQVRYTWACSESKLLSILAETAGKDTR